MSARVLIVDDHVALRKGLAQLLRSELPECDVGYASGAPEAIARFNEGHWDLAIVDLSLSGESGLSLLTEMKDRSPRTSVLVYTVHPAEQFGVRALRAGADGYLTKDAPETELFSAVRRILQGRRYISPALADSLAVALSRPAAAMPHELLSDREYEILAKLGRGFTPTGIADSLNLSVKTVSTYRTRILEKLQLRTTADLIRYAIENGLSD